MFKILLIAILLSPPFAFAKPAPAPEPEKPPIKVPDLKKDEYALFSDGKYHIFKIAIFENLKLNSECVTKGPTPTCKAYLASKAPLPVEKPAFNGNPASELCSELKGTNLIAFNYEKKQYNYCQFDDSSVVNSWSLFYKRYPKNPIK